MNKLFEIQGIEFNKKDFQDDLNEFLDLIPIISELEKELTIEKIECVHVNDCCQETKMNYFTEIQGFIDENDEFILKSDLDKNKEYMKNKHLDLFVIRIYKCTNCGKWIIDILE